MLQEWCFQLMSYSGLFLLTAPADIRDFSIIGWNSVNWGAAVIILEEREICTKLYLSTFWGVFCNRFVNFHQNLCFEICYLHCPSPAVLTRDHVRNMTLFKKSLFIWAIQSFCSVVCSGITSLVDQALKYQLTSWSLLLLFLISRNPVPTHGNSQWKQ